MNKRFFPMNTRVALAAIGEKLRYRAGGGADNSVTRAQEVGERERFEEANQRQRRLYAGLSRCNAAVATSATEEELFTRICAAAVEAAGLRLAWVGIVDGEGRVRPVASFGESQEYLKDLRIVVDANDPAGRGPTGIAIRENRPFWTGDFLRDFQRDHTSEPWRERGRRFGWRSVAAFPISRAGKPIGALSLYSDETAAIDEDAQHLLDDLAQGIGVALDRFDLERERRQAQKELLDTKSRLDSILGNIDGVIWSVDANTHRLLYLNAAAATIYGRPVREFIAGPGLWLSAVHPDDREILRARDREVQARGKAKAEFRIVRPSGVIRWIRDQSVLVRDESGRPIRLDGVAIDITAHKRTTRALIESEQKFRGLIEQAIAGIFIVQAGRLAYANPRFAAILGYATPAELIGRESLALIPEAERAQIASTVRRQARGKARSVTYATLALRQDGSTIEIGVHGSRAVFRGRPARIGMIQDISEKKRAEQEIQRYVEKLESAFMGTVEAVTIVTEMRDPYTAGHERRVAEIAAEIGAELGLDHRRRDGLRVAGHLHDIGKIIVPAEILTKPGRLSPTEFELIKEHCQSGYDVLKGIVFPWPVAQVALQHHERMDGSGYPQGLSGDAIIFEARILAVADVVEAMSSHRPYRPAHNIDVALAEIERGRGAIYDPLVADACLRLFRERHYTIPD